MPGRGTVLSVWQLFGSAMRSGPSYTDGPTRARSHSASAFQVGITEVEACVALIVGLLELVHACGLNWRLREVEDFRSPVFGQSLPVAVAPACGCGCGAMGGAMEVQGPPSAGATSAGRFWIAASKQGNE